MTRPCMVYIVIKPITMTIHVYYIFTKSALLCFALIFISFSSCLIIISFFLSLHFQDGHLFTQSSPVSRPLSSPDVGIHWEINGHVSSC